jgi:hypothetical protein
MFFIESLSNQYPKFEKNASLSTIYPSKVTTSGTTIIKSIVLRVTTLVENSTSPSPWLARIGRTASAGVADCTIKVLNSAVGKFFAVNIRIANITLLS